MKKFIYGALITTSLTQSVVYATEQPPRPTKPAFNILTTTPPPTDHVKLSPDVCPSDLTMEQLTELKEEKLKLEGHPFRLHTSRKEFEAMLPSNLQIISKGKSIAHINPKRNPSVIPSNDLQGHFVKCFYNFRTAIGSLLNKKKNEFEIVSETQEIKKDGKKLIEALKKAHPTGND